MANSRRFRLRYTLRTLLIFVTLFALWGGYHANRAVKERQAVAVLLQHGAEITDASNLTFVESLWGERLVQEVRIDTALEPDVVLALRALADPKSISISAPLLRGVEHDWMGGGDRVPRVSAPVGAIRSILRGKKLVALELKDIALSDDAFTAIASQSTLQELVLKRSNVCDDQLAKLIVLPNLHRLDCMFCPITGDRLCSVRGSVTLQALDCRGSPVGVGLAEYVARSPRVRKLSVGLFHNSCDDNFVAALGRHPSLSELRMYPGAITDRSVSALVDLPALKRVELPNTVSREGRERLLKARPELNR